MDWRLADVWLRSVVNAEIALQRAEWTRSRVKGSFRYVPPRWQIEALEAIQRKDEAAFTAVKGSRAVGHVNRKQPTHPEKERGSA